MSILIKGMDMPKNCTWCPCGRADAVTKDPMNDEIFNMFCMAKKDYWTCYRRISGKPIWCPLVEVKTPHGRLIDADKLADEHIRAEWNKYHLKKLFVGDNRFMQRFVNAPTVIESEE